jgi:hypothetical protein
MCPARGAEAAGIKSIGVSVHNEAPTPKALMRSVRRRDGSLRGGPPSLSLHFATSIWNYLRRVLDHNSDRRGGSLNRTRHTLRASPVQPPALDP